MPDKQQSIILGGLVVAVLSTSYLSLINMICCLGVILGAVIAVWHYTETNSITISTGDGAKIGALAAAFGFIVATVVNYVLIAFLDIRHDQAVGRMMLDMFKDSMPPEQYDEQLEVLNAPVTIGTVLMSAVWGLVLYPIFGAIGGLIGAKVFKKGGEEPTEFDED